MKKLLTLVALLTICCALTTNTQAQEQVTNQAQSQIIQKEFLPIQAADFIHNYLPNWKILHIVKRLEMDYVKDHYTITFKGDRVAEFDEMGALEILNGNSKEIPTGFLPTQMLNYLRENFIKQKVVYVRFEHRAGEWEAHLDDGSTARFDILGFMVRVER